MMNNRNLEYDHELDGASYELRPSNPEYQARRPAWLDARLCYAYLQLEQIANGFPEGSAEQDCVCHAMSKLDEADMLLRVGKESA